MRDKDNSRLGLYASVVAAVMVVALSVMAFIALDAPQAEFADMGERITAQLRQPNG